MKKVYEKPMFLAEEYSFATSIAACQTIITNATLMDPVSYSKDTVVCGHDKGHKFGGSDIYADGYHEITLFNDGKKQDCQFDWAGGSVVKTEEDGTISAQYGSFGKAMFGAEANNPMHTPAHDGQVFYS